MKDIIKTKEEGRYLPVTIEKKSSHRYLEVKSYTGPGKGMVDQER